MQRYIVIISITAALLVCGRTSQCAGVSVTQTTISVPTYAYESGLYMPLPDDRLQGYPYPNLRRQDVADRPQPRDYTAIVLENDYLKVTVLPDLGGRIYRLIYKPTGQSVLYENDVFKPNHFCEQGWWFSTGGIEWCFPYTEHSTNVLQVWNYRIIRSDDGSATVVVSDTHRRIGLSESISITLRPGSCALGIDIRLHNPGDSPKPYMYWTNPMIPFNDDVEVVVPAKWACAYWANDPYPWPVVDGKDKSRLANWDEVDSVFALDLEAGFDGFYDHSRDMGLVRTFPREEVKGAKVFSFGHTKQPFLQPEKYTDSGKPYFELWGGRTPSLWTDYVLGPHEVVQWREDWYPVAATGGFDWASADAAANCEVERLDSVSKRATLAIFAARDIPGATVTVDAGGQVLAAWKGDLKCGEVVRPEVVFRGAGHPTSLTVAQENRTILRCAMEEPEVVNKKEQEPPEVPGRQVEKEPVTPEEMIAADQIEAAVRVFEEDNVRGPKTATSFGIALMRTGRLDEALEQFRRAAGCRRASALPYYYAGAILLRKGQPAEAKAMLAAAVSKSPRDTRILNALGVASRLCGDSEAAIKCFEQALEQDPTNLFATAELADLGGPDTAPRLRQFLSGGAQDYLFLALRYLELGADAKAAEYALLAVEPEPDNVTALAALLVSRLRRGDGAGADEALESIRRADIENAIVYGGDSSVAALEEALRARPGESRLMLYTATAYQIRKHWTAAQEMAKNAARTEPTLARAYLIQAQSIFRKGKPKGKWLEMGREAGKLMDKCLALNPSSTAYYYFGGWIYSNAMRRCARAAAMRKALEMDEMCFPAYDVVAWDALDNRSFEEAEKWFARESNSPDHFDGESGLRYTYGAWADALLKEKKYDEALVKVAQSEKHTSDRLDLEVQLVKLRCLKALGRQDQALDLLEKARAQMENPSHSGDLWGLYSFGCMMEEMDKHEEARAAWTSSKAAAEDVLQEHPEWDGLNYIIAVSLNKLGQPKQALAHIEKLRRYFRQWPEAKEAYEEISAAAGNADAEGPRDPGAAEGEGANSSR